MRRILPTMAAIVCGILAFVDYFVAPPQIHEAAMALYEGVTILAAFALFLGILNLLGTQVRRIRSESKGRASRAVLVLSLLATLALGVLLPGSGSLSWVFAFVYEPLQATMTALLAFFAVSALYRAFRLRNVEALILLVTSLLVLLVQLPFAGALSPFLPTMRDWILAVPVTAGVRGIIMGAALGTIATALRILVAVDQPYVS